MEVNIAFGGLRLKVSCEINRKPVFVRGHFRVVNGRVFRAWEGSPCELISLLHRVEVHCFHAAAGALLRRLGAYVLVTTY